MLDQPDLTSGSNGDGSLRSPPVIELSRTVRFCVNPPGASPPTGRHNTYSGWPAVEGLGQALELEVVCRGEADPQSGYFINIKVIDHAVRDAVQPLVERAVHAQWRGGPPAPVPRLLRLAADALAPLLPGGVHRLRLHLTPRVTLALEPPAMNQVRISQQYDFSAAHRLHVPALSAQANRELFGKCNNEAGHGHNYRVEVVVESEVDGHGCALSIDALDAIVDARVIDVLDHTHLNHDVPAFKDLNPSVEHIVQVVWGMLADAMPPGTRLDAVSVWETEKTRCTYRGPGG